MNLDNFKPHRYILLSDNERRVMSYLRLQGAVSRADIARHLNLSAQSIIKIVAKLHELSLTTSLEKVIAGRGQPSVPISIINNAVYSIGVSILQNGYEIVLLNITGEIVQHIVASEQTESKFKTILAIKSDIETIVKAAKISAKQICGVGVGLSGFFVDNGSKINTPYSMEEWSVVDLERELSQAFELPVWLENDCNAAVIGEHLFGEEGSLFNSFALIYINYGFGGGLIVDNKLIRGVNGNAGELGALLSPELGKHRPTLPLLLEQVKKYQPSVNDVEQMLQLANIEPEAVKDFIKLCQTPLQQVISSIAAILDPAAIIFSSRMPKSILTQLIESTDYFKHPRRNQDRPFPQLLISKTHNIGALGAAALPLNYYFF